jgi:predicted MFS family arabinose efflux permease
MVSDRVGRVRVMRWALLGMGLGNLVAAAAPTLGVLIVAKALTGAFAGGILPTSLVYVGDKVAFERRQHVIANVLSAGAVGTVIASVGAGLLGRFASWRLVFVVPAVLALGLAMLLSRLPESIGEHQGAGPITQLRRVVRHPWALFLFTLALAEGAVVLGFLTFLAPALEGHGRARLWSGRWATYGASVFAAMQVVKRLVRRNSASGPQLITIGGILFALAYLVVAPEQAVANVLVASVLIGAAFAFLHSTLQTWATEVAPEARGTAVSLFVTGVFTGAAIGTASVSGLAGEQRYGVLFLIAALVTLPVATVAALGRARFARVTS